MPDKRPHELGYARHAPCKLTVSLVALLMGMAAIALAAGDFVLISVLNSRLPGALFDIFVLGAPLISVAGLIFGVISWAVRRRVEGDRCLVGAVLSLLGLIVGVYTIGRLFAGVR